MPYEIVVETATPVPLAAVHRRLSPREVATAWRPALDQVWAFLRRRDGLWAGGHNVFVYRPSGTPGGEMDVDFGVEVTGEFEPEGEVRLVRTPAGPAASTMHTGPIDRLGAAQAAVERWCRAHGRAFPGTSWETYGDWGPDPSTWEVRISYLLEPITDET